MSTTIESLRKLGLKVNGTEPTNNNIGNVINEIAEEYTGGGGAGGMENPMTSMGDIIYGGPNGDPTALAKGTQGQVLTATATGVAWGNAATGGGTQLYKHTITVSVDGNNGTISFITLDSTAYTDVDSIILARNYNKIISFGYTNGIQIAMVDSDGMPTLYITTAEWGSDGPSYTLNTVTFVSDVVTSL